MDNEPENWQLLHDQLLCGLQSEVRLTRELLSNMHQEEVSLMLHETGNMNYILEQRSQMLERLSALRLNRIQTTEKMEKLGSETPSSEILSLSDQLMALVERVNRQQTHNQKLSQYGDRYPLPQKIAESRVRKKAAIATYHLKQ